MTRILAVAVTALIAGSNAADALTPSGVLLAATALAVAGLIALAVRRPPLAVPARTGLAVSHERAGETIFIRLRDPGAAGRPRPRAPTPRAGAV